MNNEPTREQIAGDTAVTTVIRQQPLSNEVARYEAWLKDIIPVAQSFTGHQSVSVIRPHVPDGAYTIVLHFDNVAHLRGWLDSEVRADLVSRIKPYLQAPEAIDITTGFEFWFTPPAVMKHAAPYKQFFATWSAIFPLTLVVPWLLAPVFDVVPLLGMPGFRHALLAAVIVALMVYVIMPRYTRAISRWLYR